MCPGRVTVRLAFLEDLTPALRARYVDLLDPGECERFERFRVAGARDEFLVGRALLRTSLALIGDRPAEAWRFAMNRHGRPAIVDDDSDGLVFNLSHTRGLVALALGSGSDGAAGGEIGIDVEAIDRSAASADLASRYFTIPETAFITAGGEAELNERFFALWTLKEAYIKARGMGLALPLDGFAFDLSATDPRIAFTPSVPDDPARWRLLRRRPSERHRLALCVPAATSEVLFRRVLPLADDGGALLDLAPMPPMPNSGASAPDRPVAS